MNAALRSLAPSASYSPPIMSASKSSDAPKAIFPIYQMMDSWAAFAYSTPEVKPQHHALYFALLTIVKTKGGRTRFALDYKNGMDASSIGSRSTYIAALETLQQWGFLTYTPGKNGYKQAIIDVHFCTSTEHLLDIYRSSIGTSTDTSTGHINKDLVLTTSNGIEAEASASLARAEKKIRELQKIIDEQADDIAALKEELAPDESHASASHTGGGAAPAATPAPLADGEQPRGGYAPAELADDNPAKWLARPRDVQMVDDYLAQHPDAEVRKHAGKGKIFFGEYASKNWCRSGRSGPVPISDWRSLILIFQFRENNDYSATPGGANKPSRTPDSRYSAPPKGGFGSFGSKRP